MRLCNSEVVHFIPLLLKVSPWSTFLRDVEVAALEIRDQRSYRINSCFYLARVGYGLPVDLNEENVYWLGSVRH